MTWIEAVAVVFGLLCVALLVRQNIWCWPAGLVQVSLYVVIFYQVKLYSDMILHVFYIGFQIVGWYHWLHGGRDGKQLEVSRLASRSMAFWCVATAVGTLAWGLGMASWTDAAVPYGDAFTTVASLVAQWLSIRKRVENWLFWIGVDVVAIVIYGIKDLYLTAGLYAVFLGLSIAGFLAWRRSFVAVAKPDFELAA